MFSPNSRTWQFEKAVDRIKNDARCINVLGDKREIKAYGENTHSRWARNRPIAYDYSSFVRRLGGEFSMLMVMQNEGRKRSTRSRTSEDELPCMFQFFMDEG